MPKIDSLVRLAILGMVFRFWCGLSGLLCRLPAAMSRFSQDTNQKSRSPTGRPVSLRRPPHVTSYQYSLWATLVSLWRFLLPLRLELLMSPCRPRLAGPPPRPTQRAGVRLRPCRLQSHAESPHSFALSMGIEIPLAALALTYLRILHADARTKLRPRLYSALICQTGQHGGLRE